MVVDKFLFCLFWRMVHKYYTLNFCLEEWLINLLIYAYQHKVLLRLFHHFSFHSCCSYWILVYFRFVSHFSIFRFVAFRFAFWYISFRCVSFLILVYFVSFRFVSFVAFRFRFVVQYNPDFLCEIYLFQHLSNNKIATRRQNVFQEIKTKKKYLWQIYDFTTQIVRLEKPGLKRQRFKTLKVHKYVEICLVFKSMILSSILPLV